MRSTSYSSCDLSPSKSGAPTTPADSAASDCGSDKADSSERAADGSLTGSKTLGAGWCICRERGGETLSLTLGEVHAVEGAGPLLVFGILVRWMWRAVRGVSGRQESGSLSPQVLGANPNPHPSLCATLGPLAANAGIKLSLISPSPVRRISGGDGFSIGLRNRWKE
jgi:hypothetical protein